jgi:hypothetical protein
VTPVLIRKLIGQLESDGWIKFFVNKAFVASDRKGCHGYSYG